MPSSSQARPGWLRLWGCGYYCLVKARFTLRDPHRETVCHNHYLVTRGFGHDRFSPWNHSGRGIFAIAWTWEQFSIKIQGLRLARSISKSAKPNRHADWLANLVEIHDEQTNAGRLAGLQEMAKWKNWANKKEGKINNLLQTMKEMTNDGRWQGGCNQAVKPESERYPMGGIA